MNPLHTTTNVDEIHKLFELAPVEIKNLIKSGEVTATSTTLGQIHKLAIGNYTILSNIITLILIGALDPKDVVTSLQNDLSITVEEATSIATELEKSILEKARQINLGKPAEEVTKLEFKGGRTPEELRAEIMDTTKRTSAITVPQTSGIPAKPSVVTPGSRSQLLEQLQILGSIPKDEEIEERLKHIQEQISSIKKVEEDNLLQSNIALKSFMFGSQGKDTASAVAKTATYSAPPTKYNLDPYREVAEDY